MFKHVMFFGLLAVSVLGSTIAANAQVNKNSKTFVDEEASYYYFDDLDYAFDQCYNAFLAGEDARAGARLKRAAYFVKQESTMTISHNVKSIMKQSERLEMLADSIALGKIHAPARLRRAFAKTHSILANDNKLRAAVLWSDNKTKRTGHAMTSSVGHLAHAAKWTGKVIDRGPVVTGKAVGSGPAVAGIESIRGVRLLGSKMIQGIAFVPTNVERALKWLGRSIEKVGKDVDLKPKTS